MKTNNIIGMLHRTSLVRWGTLLVLVTLLIGGIVPLATIHAQQKSITLSVALPANFNGRVDDKVFRDFEAANPGVTVNLVDAQTVDYAATDLTAHFGNLQSLVSSADVVYVTNAAISTAAARAGYFLDLAPLVSTDPSLQIDDFYPTVWQSFQWDKGVWALPARVRVWLLIYDPAAFDKAGIAHPDAKWTLDDLANAMQKLTVKNADGTVSQPALAIRDDMARLMFYRSVIGADLVNTDTLPNSPQLDLSAAEKLLDTWNTLDQQGLIGGNYRTAPLSFAIAQDSQGEQPRGGVPFPGGKAGLEIGGFAVSSGTQNPETAYALAKFLTTRSEIPFGTYTPARKSLASLLAAGGLSSLATMINDGINNGLTVADQRFTDYVRLASNAMKTSKVNAKAALQTAEIQAIGDLQAAADKKGKLAINVATPVPQAALAAGKMALTFDLGSHTLPLPDRAAWDSVIADFTASDPQVGQIKLQPGQWDFPHATAGSDCFYLPDNAVPNADSQTLLNLDPFISADKAFDKADMPSILLAGVQHDSKTWAMPLDLQVSILEYNSDAFKKAGIPLPTNGWTVNEFIDALKALKPTPSDSSPFVTTNRDGSYILLLIAAFGGVPLDYRTIPATINLTDPATVQAIHQVLDLAKNGYIKYTGLGSLIGAMPPPDRTAMIYPDQLDAFSLQIANSKGTAYKPVLYPHGTNSGGINTNIGAAYISAKSQNPEACYRWIRTLANHPELFSGMPVRRSQLSSPALKANVNPDLLALYHQVADVLNDPKFVPFSQASAGILGTLHQYWLFKAFDKYILQNADLDSQLKDAEAISKGFQACTTGLPPLDINGNIDAIKPYAQCAIKVDASLQPLLSRFAQ